ncbi:hypothetical protein AAHA92_05428 [Salvia divinorum]|uniref:Uncharacterized protein n=1 Tax=Salvia divinorum TaxID=28513 RepID=A0ABD1I2E7_SALDI
MPISQRLQRRCTSSTTMVARKLLRQHCPSPSVPPPSGQPVGAAQVVDGFVETAVEGASVAVVEEVVEVGADCSVVLHVGLVVVDAALTRWILHPLRETYSDSSGQSDRPFHNCSKCLPQLYKFLRAFCYILGKGLALAGCLLPRWGQAVVLGLEVDSVSARVSFVRIDFDFLPTFSSSLGLGMMHAIVVVHE